MNNEQQIIELLNINGRLLRAIASHVGLSEVLIQDHVNRSLEIRYPEYEEIK